MSKFRYEVRGYSEDILVSDEEAYITASNYIKELEAENERLREALTDIASLDFGCDRTVEAVIASRALQTSDKDKALRGEEV